MGKRVKKVILCELRLNNKKSKVKDDFQKISKNEPSLQFWFGTWTILAIYFRTYDFFLLLLYGSTNRWN